MLTDWQSQTVTEYNSAIESAENIDQLEEVAMELCLSNQLWLQASCWPGVKRRHQEFGQADDRMMIVDALNWMRADFSMNFDVEETAQGFMRRLREFSRNLKARWVVVAGDSKGESYRKNLRAEYKSSRSERPSEIGEVVAKVKMLCEHSQVPYIEQEYWEADDIAATMSTRCIARGHKSIICTNDTDYMQLVNKGCVLYFKGKFTNIEIVEKTLGIKPNQVVDYLILKGKDDVTSVEGFGPKTATELLQKHGDIFGVYDHRHQLTDHKRQALEDFAKNLWSVRECHRLNRNLKIEFNWTASNCL